MNRTLIKLSISSSLSSPFLTASPTLQLSSYFIRETKAFRHFNSYFCSKAMFRHLDFVKSSFGHFLNTPIKIQGTNPYIKNDYTFSSTLTLSGYSSVEINTCVFSNCHTNNDGGAIKIIDNSIDPVNIVHCNFNNCGADGNYAIFYIDTRHVSGSIKFTNCRFYQGYLPQSIESQGITHDGAIGSADCCFILNISYCSTNECPKTYCSQNYQLYLGYDSYIDFNNCNISDGWAEKVSSLFARGDEVLFGSIYFVTFSNIKSGHYVLDIDGLYDFVKEYGFRIESCNFIKIRLKGSSAAVVDGSAFYKNCMFLDIIGSDTYYIFSERINRVNNVSTDVSMEHISIDAGFYILDYNTEIHFISNSKFTKTDHFTSSDGFSPIKNDIHSSQSRIDKHFSSCESSSRDNENGNDINNNNDGSNDQNDKNKDKSNTVLVAAVGGVTIFLLVAFIIALIVMVTVYKASKHAIESDSGIHVSIKSTNSSSYVDKTSVNALEVTEDDCVIIDPNSIDDEGSENIIARQFDISTFPIISIEGGNCSNDEKQRDMIVQADPENLHPIVFYDAKNNIDDKQEEIETKEDDNVTSLDNEEPKEVSEDEVIPKPVRKKRPGRRKKKVIKEELLDSDDDVEFSFTRPETPRKVDEIDPQASFVSFDPINDEESVKPKKKRRRINRKVVHKNESILTDITDSSDE